MTTARLVGGLLVRVVFEILGVLDLGTCEVVAVRALVHGNVVHGSVLKCVWGFGTYRGQDIHVG